MRKRSLGATDGYARSSSSGSSGPASCAASSVCGARSGSVGHGHAATAGKVRVWETSGACARCCPRGGRVLPLYQVLQTGDSGAATSPGNTAHSRTACDSGTKAESRSACDSGTTARNSSAAARREPCTAREQSGAAQSQSRAATHRESGATRKQSGPATHRESGATGSQSGAAAGSGTAGVPGKHPTQRAVGQSAVFHGEL